MNRRSFLGTLTALSAAVASGIKLPKAAEVAKAAPAAIAWQDRLMEMLKDCHVVSIAGMATIDGPMTYEVEYIHTPGGPSKKGKETLMVDSYTAGMRPISVNYSIGPNEVARMKVEWA